MINEYYDDTTNYLNLTNSEWSCFKGIIIPVAWNELDQITTFSLFMEDERELIIKPANNFSLIKKHMNKSVIVCGLLLCEDFIEIHDVSLKLNTALIKHNILSNHSKGDEYILHIPQTLKMEILH